MPPKRNCTVHFLKQILEGTKSYFTNTDIPNVFVQKLDGLTVKSVLAQVYNVPEVRAYLPDFDENPERYINREYLFAIVNRIDPSYFRRA